MNTFTAKPYQYILAKLNEMNCDAEFIEDGDDLDLGLSFDGVVYKRIYSDMFFKGWSRYEGEYDENNYFCFREMDERAEELIGLIMKSKEHAEYSASEAALSDGF